MLIMAAFAKLWPPVSGGRAQRRSRALPVIVFVLDVGNVRDTFDCSAADSYAHGMPIGSHGCL